MSKPTNSAARNAMTEREREIYDWGWEDAEARIVKLLENPNTVGRWWGKPEKNIGIYGTIAAYIVALIKDKNE